MKVTLIDYTGAGSLDPLYAARLLVYTKSTRLTQGEETRNKIQNMPEAELKAELEYMADTIRSSWEFCQLIFEIKDVTRAFTHQLVRTRYGVSFAQQAQRVVDMSKFETRIPKTVRDIDQGTVWSSAMKSIEKAYAYYQSVGAPNQDCRGLLPTNVLTNIIARFDLRALADVCAKRDNARAQDEYVEVVQAMKAATLEVWPWAKVFLEPDRTATPALNRIMARLLGTDSPVDHPEINTALKEIDRLKGTWG
jgi:flavin-dependent thymidylate synthase